MGGIFACPKIWIYPTVQQSKFHSQSCRKFFPEFFIRSPSSQIPPIQFFHILEIFGISVEDHQLSLHITGADEAQGEAPGRHGTHGPRGGLGAAAPGRHRSVAPRRSRFLGVSSEFPRSFMIIQFLIDIVSRQIITVIIQLGYEHK